MPRHEISTWDVPDFYRSTSTWRQQTVYSTYNDSRSRSRTIINGFNIIANHTNINEEITYKETDDQYSQSCRLVFVYLFTLLLMNRSGQFHERRFVA
jgi:hypothetical protein